jgi:hypothetical protein
MEATSNSNSGVDCPKAATLKENSTETAIASYRLHLHQGRLTSRWLLKNPRQATCFHFPPQAPRTAPFARDISYLWYNVIGCVVVVTVALALTWLAPGVFARSRAADQEDGRA